MPAPAASDQPTRPHHRSSGDGSPISAVKGGVVIKWSIIGTAAAVLMGAGWRYADGRWAACETWAAQHQAADRATGDRLLILEQQAAADRQRADERHADLRAQLAQIQAQLSQIQADLRRSGR